MTVLGCDYESGRCAAGHINHSLFWKNLAPSASEGKGNGGVLRDGPLKDAIVKGWGSLDNFKKEFNATTAAIQGSGWGWLVSAPVQDRLIRVQYV